MDHGGMNMFLSSDNIMRHYEHLRTLKLRFSILEKSYPRLKDYTIDEIYHLNIDKKWLVFCDDDTFIFTDQLLKELKTKNSSEMHIIVYIYLDSF